ncbi:hypothetical protein AKJ09_00900 [Labilithrix luteola]|uniref:Uncharacterized protein n=1 Tax=Labilithrix luteola TaxID=1391654 RepID=A0A0K1PLH5_9BACT|nr:hypothetical protein [Labilithrix luteola]AKU94236.1 hypothetical protein AKJ09_00900 [Labilithrix luteola]
MAFPRAFRGQTWFVQLPSGEIEVVTSSALERAFHCGLVSARTPVRAFATPIWTTLGEAASFEDGEPSTISSLAPIAMASIPPADDSAQWRVGSYLETMFEPPKSRTIGAVAMMMGAVMALAAVGIARIPNAIAGAGASHAAALARESPKAPEAMALPPPAPIPPPTPMPAAAPAPSASAKHLTNEQRYRLRMQDAAQRWAPRDKTHSKSRTPIEPPSDRLLRGGSRFDPLNGAL